MVITNSKGQYFIQYNCDIALTVKVYGVNYHILA